MATQVTHNNDGHFYTIDVDLAKEGAEVFDLTTYFKARVADNNVGLRFRWFWQGQVFNTVGKKPRVVGLVGQYSFKKSDDGTNRELVMSPDASSVAFTGDVNDCEPGGYATYYFPEQMFPQDGMFKGTVGLLDDSGETARYTSVDIWFKVYPQAGGAQMGKACDYYIDELDKAIKEAEEDLKAGQKAQQQIIDEYQQKVTGLVNQLNAQGQTANSMLETVKAGLTTLEAKIQQDGLFTQAEAEAFKQEIKKEIAKLKLPDVINIKEFGAVGDGLTDDSAVFQKAINTGEEIFIPNGTYEVDTTLVPKDESTPLIMHGQTPGKVIFKSTQSKVMDFTSSKNLVMSNISSDKVMGIIDYDPDNKTNDHTQDRFIQLDNIWNTSAGTKMINWDHLVVTPKMDEDPLAGNINNHSGKYARYPLEIYNNGGFNALNINNSSQSVEASAIGITDSGGKVAPLSTPTIFISQHGNRAYMKVLNSGMDKPAFEGSGNTIAIGAEVSTSDNGVANLKLGSQTWPTISLIERDSNKAGSIIYSNDKLMFFTDGGKDVLDVAKDGLTTGNNIQIKTEDPIGYTIVRNGHVKTMLLDSNGYMRFAGSFAAKSDTDAQLVQVCQSGSSKDRPALKNAPNDIGFRYFDRSLGKPVFWDGINWVTADGIKAYGAIDAEPADNAEH